MVLQHRHIESYLFGLQKVHGTMKNKYLTNWNVKEAETVLAAKFQRFLSFVTRVLGTSSPGVPTQWSLANECPFTKSQGTPPSSSKVVYLVICRQLFCTVLFLLAVCLPIPQHVCNILNVDSARKNSLINCIALASFFLCYQSHG